METKTYKPRTLTAPQMIFPWLNEKAETWFIGVPHVQKWSCAITIDGMDYQEYGDTRKEAIQNMGNRILSSEYLTAMVPDEAIKPS